MGDWQIGWGESAGWEFSGRRHGNGAGSDGETAAGQPGVGCEEEMALSRRAEQPGWDVEKGRR